MSEVIVVQCFSTFTMSFAIYWRSVYISDFNYFQYNDGHVLALSIAEMIDQLKKKEYYDHLNGKEGASTEIQWRRNPHTGTNPQVPLEGVNFVKRSIILCVHVYVCVCTIHIYN